MKILLIGNGAREHAIAQTLKRSRYSPSLICFAKANNPGIQAISDDYKLGNLLDEQKIISFARLHKPDFAIIGPEDPIAGGISDALEKIGVPTVAPSKNVAKLEASKSFARELLPKHKIPGCPKFKVFYSTEGLKFFLEHDLEGDFVVKADGLKGGKGVKVVGDHLKNVEEGFLYAKECIREAGKVVIDEKLIGQEFSLMSFVDGENVVDMIPVQDHKRAYEGDKGPNTGGMGSYSCENHSLPFLTKNDLKEAHTINVLTARAIKKELHEPFKGIMYGGFIATRKGVHLIEYNVRFGDPEAMNILPILKTDFVDICKAILEGSLDKLKIEFENKATVCKYAVPDGYPDNPIKDKKIEIEEIITGTHVYFASVDKREDSLYLGGSRAVAVTGIGNDMETAEVLAEKGIQKIKGPVFHRKDIGTEELIKKRVEMMRKLRQ